MLGVLVFSAFLPVAARADGYVMPLYGYEGDILAPGQKAIIVYDEEAGREELILSIKLLGKGSEAAWVVPVPALPEVGAASADWFLQLSDLTQPYVYHPVSGCGSGAPMAGAPEGTKTGVELVSRERVGVYDVSTLSADDPRALLTWLNEHGYTFPAQGEPILEAYVREGGWYFVATRVVPEEADNLAGDVQPLWLSFAAEEPVYPMRLTALSPGALDVLLYVLADHRFELDGFETEFAGELTLAPVDAEGEALSNLLTGRAYYVTRLRNLNFDPAGIKGDLYFRRASNDDTCHKMITEGSGSSLLGFTPLGLMLGLAVAGPLWSWLRQRRPR